MPWAIALAAFLTSCGHHESRRLEPEGPAVEVTLATAHEENLDTFYRASGTVRGFTTAVVTSKTTGYVQSVDVRAGDHVRVGQRLAVLEANDAAAIVRRTRASVVESVEARTEAENARRAAHAEVRLAKATYERIAALYESRAITRQQLDEAQAHLDGAIAEEEMAEARVRGSFSRINQASAAAGEAQATLDYSKITAPFSGRIIERRIDPGNLASPGMPLVVIEEEENPRVEAAVEESRATHVALGDTAIVDIGALGRSFEGTVGEVVPSVDVASRAFLVKVDLPAGVVGLRPGMFARVSFRVGTRSRLVVPATAITSQGELDRVLVADDDRLRLRMITLGEAQGPFVEVLSGLAPGERVVAVVTPSTRDGARFTEQP